MNTLNKRQITLIKLLMEHMEYTTIEKYSEELNVSYKTISNDTKIINDWLNSFNMKLDKKPHKGILLEVKDHQFDQLNTLINNLTGETYTDINTRRDLIYLDYLWNSNQYFSIQRFSDLYYVSSSSIINDNEVIIKRLGKFHIQLKKSSKGTKIQASEISIRKALVNYIERYIYQSRVDNNQYQSLNKMFQQLISNYINIEEILDFFEEKMVTIETVSKKIINEPYYTNALIYLLVMILRIKNGYIILSKEELFNKDAEIDQEEFKFAQYLVNEISNTYEIEINEAETINVYRHLMSGGLSKKEIAIVEKNTKENNLNSLTLAYTRYLIEKLSILLGVDLTNQIYLHSNLRFHIKPMINRLHYDIYITNMMLDEIKQRYPLEFTLTKISCSLASRYYELKEPTDGEVAYILVYVQSAMERHIHDVNAILVSSNSMGSALLMKTRIENSIEGLYIKDILSPYKLNSKNMDAIDLIISTGEVTMNLPSVVVSVFCDDADIKTIRYYVKKMKKQTVIDIESLSINIEENKDIDCINPIIIQLSSNIELYFIQSNQRKINLKKDSKKLIYAIYYQDLREITALVQHVLNLV